MLNPIHVLERLDVPTTSYIAAVANVKERFADDKATNHLLRELTGDVDVSLSGEQAMYTCYYVVQDVVKAHLKGEEVDTNNVYQTALESASVYINRMDKGDLTFLRAEPEESVKVDAGGKPKRKKGAKQEEALRIFTENMDKDKKEIIAMFMSELDMSKSGATTYYYNTKKKVGE